MGSGRSHIKKIWQLKNLALFLRHEDRSDEGRFYAVSVTIKKFWVRLRNMMINFEVCSDVAKTTMNTPKPYYLLKEMRQSASQPRLDFLLGNRHKRPQTKKLEMNHVRPDQLEKHKASCLIFWSLKSRRSLPDDVNSCEVGLTQSTVS